MPLYLILGFVVVQRLCELAYARRNTVRLLARGGTETGAGHYPLFVLLHSWRGSETLSPRSPDAPKACLGEFG